MRLAGLDAAAVGVRPLVLIAVTAGTDERRRGPCALVIGFVAAAVVPCVQVFVGHRFARLMADEVLLIERGVAERLTSTAACPRLDRVFDIAAAVAEVAVIRAVRETRSAARG